MKFIERGYERREDQDENEPIGIADPLDKLKHSLIARPMREPTRARNLIPRLGQRMMPVCPSE